MSGARPAAWYVQGDGRLRYWDGRAWTPHFLAASSRAVGDYPHVDGSSLHWDGEAWARPSTSGRPPAPRPRHSWRGRRYWVAGGLALALIVGAVALASPSNADVVERTIDGDTLVIKVDGDVEHVRLLNIDTPETKDPNKPVECLGPEASAFTHDLVPDGTKVNLVYDEQKRDRYGRLLATVYLEDGRSLSEELARAGLGVPIAVGANRSHLNEVKAAQGDAIERGVGFYNPAQKCTVPSQYREALSGLSGATGQAPTTSRAAAAQVATMSAALVSARLFLKAASTPSREIAWSLMSASRLQGMTTQLHRKIQQANADLRKMKSRRSSLKAQEARNRAAKAAAAAARKQAWADARKAARAKAAAAATARAEARRREDDALERAAESEDDGDSDSGSGGLSGYTGPRCYDPGGVTWHPC